MAARRYEISLRVLKNISRVSAYLLYKHQKIPNHFIFAAKGAIYHVTIVAVLFSRVKITVIFMCEDITFSRESSPGISLLFI